MKKTCALFVLLVGCGGADFTSSVPAEVGGSSNDAGVGGVSGSSGQGGIGGSDAGMTGGFAGSTGTGGFAGSGGTGGQSGSAGASGGAGTGGTAGEGGSGGEAGSGGSGGTGGSSGTGGIGTGGSGGCVYGNHECPGKSCADIFDTNPQTGSYWISINQETIQVHCDMTFNNSGWTLFFSSKWNSCTTEGIPTSTSSSLHMEASLVKELAKISTMVHIRTKGKGTEESITSTINSQPIINLRVGRLLNYSFTMSDWNVNGNITEASLGGNDPGPNYTYPILWFTETVDGKTKILTVDEADPTQCVAKWSYNYIASEDIEAYVGGINQ